MSEPVEKYALYKYKNSNNVGDEIQSIAARRFLPRVDYFIDRDEIGQWVNPNQDEIVKLIANGWYMHAPYAWPITDKTIRPLLASIHINEGDSKTAEAFRSSRSRKYMSKYGPVGARDHATQKFFNHHGIESYFSACMTLTLQRDPRIIKQDYILAISLTDETYNFLKQNTKKRVIRFNPNVDRGIDSIQKMKMAEYILFLYQSALCVVTTRVHAMLPSLAIETPVLFVDENEEFDPSRFDGLIEFVNSITKQDLLSGNFEYDFDNPRPNPKNHLKYREDLIRRGEEATGYKGNKSFLRLLDISKIDQKTLIDKIPVSDVELSTSDLLRDLKPPAFSIIMPTYNIKQYIYDAVQSIKNQNFTDFECIIVDDGSTDGGVDQIQKLIEDDKRFKVITQSNGGLSNARNNGYKDAKGEYILFLDGDDVFSDVLLSTLNEKITETDADVVVYNHSVLDNTTGYTTKGIHKLEEFTDKVLTARTISRSIFNVFGNQVWTKAFKRELIEKHGLKFNEDLKRAEDIPYTYPALLLAKKIAVINEPLVAYRINRGSSNSDMLTKFYKDIFSSLETLNSVINQQKSPEDFKDSFSKLFLENVYYNLNSLLGSDKFEDEFVLAKKFAKNHKINSIKNDDSTPNLANFYSIITEKEFSDALEFMLIEEKKISTDRQTTIYHLDNHVTQLKDSLQQSENKLKKVQQDYFHLKERFDKIIRIPRKLKREALKIKGRLFNGK